MDYQSIREWIFKLDPENAHNIVEFISKSTGDISFFQDYLKKHFVINDQRLKQKQSYI